MLRAIRVLARQHMANYKKPSSFSIRESYPLPPYSTVIGMIHAVSGFDTYHPMDVSIQGVFGSSVSDKYTRYTFGIAFDPERHDFYVENNGKKDGVTRGLGHCQVLCDVGLVLHIAPEQQEDIDIIYQSLKNPRIYPSLGRHEDLLIIDEVKIVELQMETDEEEYTLDFDAFVPERYFSNVKNSGSTIYKINKIFRTDNKNGIRTWDERIKVKHVSKNIVFSGENLYLDFYDENDGEQTVKKAYPCFFA